MKIALLLPITLSELQPLFPGQELTGGYPYSLFVPLVYYYISLGHEVVICTEDKSSIKSSIYYGKNITVFCAGTLPRAKLSASIKFKYEINQMVNFFKENPCDIYHAHWVYNFAQAALNVNPEKTLITIHDWPDNIRLSYNDFYWKRRLDMGEKTLQQGKFFTAVSPYILDKMIKKYDKQKVKLVPNLINVNTENKFEKQFENKKQIIISISNGFSKHKNIESLILAFEKVRQEFPNSVLRLIGNDLGKGEKAEKWAMKYSKIDGIEFVGKIENDRVINELKEADILVHPSLEESFGMVILEAMLNFLPVIAGECSGAIPWLLENGQSGVLVNVKSPKEIANSIVNLLNDSNKMIQLAYKGNKRAKMFSVEKIGNMYIKAYEDIISNKF